MSYRIMGIARGTYSGVPEFLFDTLAKKHNIVKIFDSKLSKPLRYYNHLNSYLRTAIALHDLPSYPSPWRQLTDKNSWRWIKETERCEREIARQKDNIDLVLQIGSKQGVYTKKPIVPYAVYTDGTAISERGYPIGGVRSSEAEKTARIKLEATLYRNASIVLTFSECTRMSVINDYGIAEHKVATVYAGANLKEIPSTLEKEYDNKTILFVGKDFDRKGGPTLINAFKEVKKEVKDAKLIIVSEPNPNFPSRMHTLLDFFGIKVKVSKPRINLPELIKSQVPYEELIQLYKDASIFVMPSIQENFGHVFLEAMAFKTPCIGTTVDAMPEIIENGKTGFLVSPNDYKQLADKLVSLLEDENLMKKMGEQGRKRVEKYFTWNLVVDRMTKRFEKII